jgi:hypothetical protein
VENFNLDSVNGAIMPKVKEIQNKMQMLKEKYNANIETFDFKEITPDDILKNKEK